MTEVRWLGQMGLMISSGGTTVCVDYFASLVQNRQTPPPVKAEELKGIDAFLGTHDHLDHIDHEAWKIWAKTNPAARFVFPSIHKEKILADGVEAAHACGMDDGECLTIGNMKIHAIYASHEFPDRDSVTGAYPYLQYIIETEGVRIHHAGDTVRYEGMMPRLRSFGRFDLQILPINGRDAVRYRNDCIGNMTYQEAADLAGELEPGIVIPGHWDMFADNSEDPVRFADYLKVKYRGKIKCLIPKVMESIVL